MAYGFIATNGSNQTVINDTEPLYVEKRSGSLSNSGQTNKSGVYKFFNAGNSITTNEEICLFTVSVGSWLTFNLPITPTYLGDMCSDQTSLSYKVFGPRTDLANPTGYGTAVYNSAGNCVWDAASTVTRINNAGRVDGSACASKTYASGNIAGGNAVYCAEGPAVLDFDVAYYCMSANRTGTSTWTFTQRPITQENYFQGGDATFISDFSYILGVV
jgi:hypothetical protein